MSPESPANPATRLPWLLIASLGLGLSVAAVMIEDVGWVDGPPELAAWIGRFHPVVLHFPIVLLLVALAFEAARLPVFRRFLPAPDSATVTAVLGWGAAGCTVALACGWLLAQSGDYDQELLDSHLWAGAATGLGANLALALRISAANMGRGVFTGLSNLVLLVTCAILTAAGHYGASITHGDTYLTDQAPEALRQFLGLEPRRVVDPNEIKPVEQRLLWDDVVQPIFEERCNSCHRESKFKGGLRLDTLAGLLKGGETGAAMVAGQPAESLLLQRIHLELEDEKHMPPQGKPQATPEQVAALTFWIANGAPADKRVGDFEMTDDVRAALDSLLTPSQRLALEENTRAEAEALEVSLATLRAKLPGSLESEVPGQPELVYAPGIAAAQVDDSHLVALAPVAGSVVAMELQQTKISDAGLAALAPFVKLRQLQLQNTALTDAGMVHLGKLASLEDLNFYGTAVSDAGLLHLAGLKHLRKINVWQTQVSVDGAKELCDAIPGLEVNFGLTAPAAETAETAPATAPNKP